jgi:type IV pilus assembly protein PilC
VLVAIDITRDVAQNTYYQATLDEMKKKIGQGLPFAEIFEKNEKLYPPFVGELVAVGEETGKLPEMLGRVADFYENEVEQRTKDMSTIIEPLLMIVVGAVVGFFAVSMITPIYSIGQNI